MILEIKDLSVSYGAVRALKNFSMELPVGGIVTLIGANGAGKSTVLRAISGLVKPESGEILFEGASLKSVPPHRIVGLGLVHCPEGRGIFPNLTVLENLDLGAYTRKDRRGLESELTHVYQLFPRLLERRSQPAGTLSGGEQQMLAIGRALMARPKLLLLDEPSLGLAPQVVELIFEVIQKINREGCSVLLVEQNAHLALEIAHHAYVLETGSLVMQGKASDIAKDPRVIAAYLGG
ncbi:MAG: ABC transporter ATP-binding protein [candidate division FCPU426 bacterium]